MFALELRTLCRAEGHFDDGVVERVHELKGIIVRTAPRATAQTDAGISIVTTFEGDSRQDEPGAGCDASLHRGEEKCFLTCNHMVAYCPRVMDAVFKALADASRRKLLDELHKNNGQTLGELCEHLDMTRQAVTKHLALLEAANLVVTVWRGREQLHYLNPVPIHEISERWIGKYERHRLQALSDLKKGLEENKNKKS